MEFVSDIRTQEEHDAKAFTVGELLEYIRKNEIPDDAVILVEQAGEYYFSEDRLKGGGSRWDHFICDFGDGLTGLYTNVGNGLGRSHDKHYLMINQHY